MAHKWHNTLTLDAKSFVCGYCGKNVGSASGYFSEDDRYKANKKFIYICPFCACPTLFDESNRQFPGNNYGVIVSNVTDETVLTIYEEARKCFSVSAYSAVALCCRKLLMQLA